MAKAIQVVEVRVYTYTPNLNEIDYSENKITTIEAALAFDKAGVDCGEAFLDEIAAKDPVTTRVWSIIGE